MEWDCFVEYDNVDIRQSGPPDDPIFNLADICRALDMDMITCLGILCADGYNPVPLDMDNTWIGLPEVEAIKSNLEYDYHRACGLADTLARKAVTR